MKKFLIIVLVSLTVPFFTFFSASAQSASDILQKVDDIINAPKDQFINMTITIYDKSLKESVRTMVTRQKGSDKRLVKFLTPADQKGIGFLSLPNDNLTVYLPAFGKTRKIGSSVKNSKFAGTDFSYEDMEAKRYSSKWNPKLITTAGGFYVLELTPKTGIVTDYLKLMMYVRTQDNYPVKVEHYDKGGKLYKVLTDNKITKIGSYTIAKELVMEDKKNGTKTKMVMTSIKFDNGFTDDIFSERELIK